MGNFKVVHASYRQAALTLQSTLCVNVCYICLINESWAATKTIQRPPAAGVLGVTAVHQSRPGWRGAAEREALCHHFGSMARQLHDEVT